MRVKAKKSEMLTNARTKHGTETEHADEVSSCLARSEVSYAPVAESYHASRASGLNTP